MGNNYVAYADNVVLKFPLRDTGSLKSKNITTYFKSLENENSNETFRYIYRRISKLAPVLHYADG